ncbi:MAG: hypothetical protein JXA99_10260 [Candidatus Lokiarchaeota archaeon]|nr:hypothetical protein [Candidatus Lokiarchaeota archaeon]
MKLKKKPKTLLLICTVLFSNIFFFILTNSYKNNIFTENIILNQKKTANLINTAQTNESGWITIWGEPDNLVGEWGIKLITDENGNIFVVGTVTFWENNTRRIFFLKFDVNGTLMWERFWNKKENNCAVDIALDENNNTYILGYTADENLNNTDICIIKYNSNGVFQWEQFWGGMENEVGRNLLINNTDSIYITGYTENYNINKTYSILLQYNSTGDLQWNSTWINPDQSFGSSMIIDSLGDLYLIGTANITDVDIPYPFLLQYNSSGAILSNKSFVDLPRYNPLGIVKDTNDNLYIAGYLHGLDITDITDIKVFLFKYNFTGNIIWNKTWGGVRRDDVEDIAIDNMNNIYLTGYTNNFGDSTNIFLLKYNSTGNLERADILGGSSIDVAFGITIDSHNNIYLTGVTQFTSSNSGNLFLIKYIPDTVYFTISNSIPGFDFSILIGIFSIFTISIIIMIRKRIKYIQNKSQ